MIIELRHGDAAVWTAANPVLIKGEFGVEDDTTLFKKGDGVTAWNDLAYANAGGGGGSTGVPSVFGRTGAVVAVSGDYTFAQIGAKPTTLTGYGITDAASSAQGARADTAVQPGSLAAVATTGAYSDLSGKPSLFSGSYVDLTNKPTIPTNNNQLANGAGYVTTDTTYSVATTTVDGLMSAADKTKLDGLGGGGNYTLPTASDTVLGGVKIGANVTITGGVISVAAPVTNNAVLTNGAGYITSASLSGYALTSQLFSGSYTDLTNKPAIPAAQVNSDWNASSGVAQILNKPALALVATTGAYSDLTGKPTIPAAQVNADWNAASGVAQILNKPALATVATSGSYTDLSNKPAIPSMTGANAIAVVATLPGTPDPNTLYFVTT